MVVGNGEFRSVVDYRSRIFSKRPLFAAFHAAHLVLIHPELRPEQ